MKKFSDSDTFDTVAADRVTVPASVQQALPYDDERNVPIAYTLTPAAQQLVAPGSRPQLTAVPPRDDDAVDRDPRRAQVKAMHRGGIAPETIAEQLEIDLLLVRSWLDLAPIVRHERAPARDVSEEGTDVACLTEADAYRASEQFGNDPQFAFAVGVLAATAEIDASSVTMTFTDRSLAATVFTLLRRHAPMNDSNMQVIMRLAPRSHGDVVRSQWADVFALDPSQLRTVRRASGATDEALVRVVDSAVAARCALWCDTALHNPAATIDVAF